MNFDNHYSNKSLLFALHNRSLKAFILSIPEIETIQNLSVYEKYIMFPEKGNAKNQPYLIKSFQKVFLKLELLQQISLEKINKQITIYANFKQSQRVYITLI
ncbi:hypothetical protein pb186bvf_016406 [Paramecium bursaria]